MSDTIALDVPLRTVTKGSNLCQLATALMVMEYYGESLPTDASEAEVLAMEKYTEGKNERHSQAMALWLIGKGYDVAYGHNDLGVLDAEMHNLSEKDLPLLKEKLAALPHDSALHYARTKRGLDIDLIEAGARFSTELKELSYIDQHLMLGHPVIVTIKANAIYHTAPKSSHNTGNHSIVITGKDGNIYRYNDNNYSKPRTIEAKTLLRAWHMIGAYNLIITPKHT